MFNLVTFMTMVSQGSFFKGLEKVYIKHSKEKFSIPSLSRLLVFGLWEETNSDHANSTQKGRCPCQGFLL